MKKLFALFMVACIMMLALAACGDGGNNTGDAGTNDDNSGPASVDAGDGILIGGLAPLTGGVSQYGIAVNNGAQMAVDEINANGGILGQQIVYVCEDEQGDATEAINAYNKLMSDGIVALVGDVTTGPTIAVAQKAAQDGIPMITASATGASVTEFGDNIFRACFIDPYQGQIMAHYADERLDAKTAAVLYDKDDDYSTGVAEAFIERAGELGIEVLTVEQYPSGNVDFNSYLTKIKENEPDVVMAPCYYEDAANIVVQARNMGIESLFLGPDGWDTVLNQVDDSNKDLLNGSYYCNQYSPKSDNPALQQFISDYVERFSEESLNMFAVLGYDAMYMMCLAIEAAGSTDAEAIVAALAATNYDGLTGTTTFDSERNPVREAYITEFVDGEAVVREAYKPSTAGGSSAGAREDDSDDDDADVSLSVADEDE